ncbi:hypothetical protein ACSNOH_18400 [Streptomyces sp. URMC 127]|uniref:hypothetical protein n=1 Tax=Streptomyces sp. URMC 127 TaxID=3423402 RepID=UPI003F1BA738
MLEARLGKTTIRAQDIYRLGEEERKRLICAHCSCTVRAVREHFKGEDGPNPFKVGAHFRLPDGVAHEATCDFNPDRVVEEIARGSAGLADVQPDGTLRLVLPDNLGAADAPPPQPPTTTDAAADGEQTSLRITTASSPVLPPALNSAVKIVRFLQAHDFDAEATRLFRLSYGPKHRRLSWARFCYHPQALPQLHQRLATGRALDHPIAVYGTVVRTGRAQSGKPYVLLAERVPSGPEGATFSLCLRSEYPQLLDGLRAGMQVLAVGPWKVWPRAQGPDEVQLWVDAHWRLER